MSHPEDETAAEDGSFWDQLGHESQEEPADWSGDELEEAYMRAMEVLEASEIDLPEPVVSTNQHINGIDRALDQTPAVISVESATETASDVSTARIETINELKDLAETRTARPVEQSASVSPRWIIEACLFVGGEPLTAKRLCGVLRGEFSVEFVEREVDQLNSLYIAEGRPYEIRLAEGGYRLTLREEYERIRHKAYGLGPKEVRLTQEALEILAVVAYQQPISASAIQELGKPGCGGILRQLLRRELIAVERQASEKDVKYRTTQRFLSVFGLRDLNELPRLEQVGYK